MVSKMCSISSNPTLFYHVLMFGFRVYMGLRFSDCDLGFSICKVGEVEGHVYDLKQIKYFP